MTAFTVGGAVKVAKAFDHGGHHFEVGALGTCAIASYAPKFLFPVSGNGVSIIVIFSSTSMISAGYVVPV